MIEGTQTLNPGGFNLPENYNPLHDPKVKTVTDALHSQIAILNKSVEEAKPILEQWKKAEDEKKTQSQRFEELTRKNQELENWQKQTVKKALIDTKLTHKLNELAMNGTSILPQFIPKEQLFQVEDVNSDAFNQTLDGILNQALIDQTVAFKMINQPVRPPFPTQTPGIQGSPGATPPPVSFTGLTPEYEAALKQVYGQNTVIRKT